MPIFQVSGLVLMVRNIGGCVVLPYKFQHGSPEIVDWSSDIPCLNVEIVPMCFSTRVKSSFSLPDPIDKNMFNDVNS
eukprot:2649121-Heterocapsa_arctica.AAC.1